MDPYGDVSSCGSEGAVAFFVDDNGIGAVSQCVPEGYAGMLFSHQHAYLAIVGVADDNCKSGIGMFFFASPHPADQVGIVKIVLLFSVCVSASDFDHFSEIRNEGAVLYGISVVIGIKHTWYAALTQEDHGVGKGLEPVGNKGLQALAVLCVVVVHKCDG